MWDRSQGLFGFGRGFPWVSVSGMDVNTLIHVYKAHQVICSPDTLAALAA